MHDSGGSASINSSIGAADIVVEPHDLTLFDKIGEGTFGVVYLAHCRGQTVAVKRLKKTKLPTGKLLELHREIQIMRRLKSNNLVLMLGLCDEGDNISLVMEYVEGWNLGYLLHDMGMRLSIEQKLRITKDIAAGCNWLHRMDPPIVHRDLKPENVIIGADLKTVKLCDFGFACVKPTDEESRICGTPLYMSLERLYGDTADEKSDVYSYGLIIWEMWEQQVPFSFIKDMKEFIEAVEKHLPISEQVPEPVGALIQRCWGHKRQRPSFAEILAMLDDVIVDTLITDPLGRELWKKGKGKDVNYPFELNYTLVLKLIEEHAMKACLYAGGTVEECFKAQVAVPPPVIREGRKLIVKCDEFGKFLEVFGPLDSRTLPQFERICSEGWYHGPIDSKTAEERLGGQKPGSFLIRQSTTERNFLALSKKEKDNVKPPFSHQRIYKSKDRGFIINVGDKRAGGSSQLVAYPSLIELVEEVRGKLGLSRKHLCANGSVFAGIFEGRNIDDENKLAYIRPLDGQTMEEVEALKKIKKKEKKTRNK